LLPALALVLLILLPAVALAAPPSTRLAAADEAMVGHYEAGKAEAVAKLPLVILVSGGQITVYRHGVAEDHSVAAQGSVDMKACAHAMLGFYGVMQPVAAGDHSAAQWARVRAYLKLVASMPALILDDPYVPAGPAEQAAGFLRRLRKSTEAALARGSESHAQLVRDERAVRPAVMSASKWAGRAFAAELLGSLREVRAESSKADWRHAWAVVAASPAATRDNLETATMIKVMGRGALGHRLFVSQNTFDPKSLLATVSGLYYDQTLSRTVFADAFRMWRDLFAPVAVALTGFSYLPAPAAG